MYCPEITDRQLRDLAHRLRQYRFTLLVLSSDLDAVRLLQTRLMPLLSRRNSDLRRSAESSVPGQGGERRADQQTETAVFFEDWRAMQHRNALEWPTRQRDDRTLLVIAGLGDALRDAGKSEEAGRWLEALAQAYWGLDGPEGRPVQLLLAMDQAAMPLLEALRLHGLPVDEAIEHLAPSASPATTTQSPSTPASPGLPTS